jgi:ribonuclease HI
MEKVRSEQDLRFISTLRMVNQIVPNPGVRKALHRRFETALSRKSVGAIRQVASFLLRLEKSGAAYSACLQLLEHEFRDAVTSRETGLGTDESRRRRAYAQEAFHLIRRELQHQRGFPQSKAHSFSFGQLSTPVTAHIDGSVRNGNAAIGVFIHVGNRDIVTASMTVNASNSAEAEMHALVVAMKTALALGRLQLIVFTDAEALVALLAGKSKLRFHPVGRDVLRLVGRFTGLAVQVVPRIYNHRADRLALERTGLS